MDPFFLIILLFLALLAGFHLFVGISNDAVNFLSSAVGSRIASFRTILIVASIGVLSGATFSSGMMEIARSGIFHPQMFTFSEVMMIFFAVVVSDVLLIDRFNSLGLPTSTTVSLIFDLLGAATAAAAIKVWRHNDSLLTIADYINNEKTLAIVSGIFISVGIAFVAGTLVQYVTRLIFTFRYEKMYRRLGGLFGGVAITAIFYFLVMKGLKGTSFMTPEHIDWVHYNTLPIMGFVFAGSTILFQTLILFFDCNIFKIIILSGTFALAFAFAGNDLVNFVGVPLAAYDSFFTYLDSGLAPDELTMASLKGAARTPTFFLLLAGAIMVLSLWLSKKARHVMQTSINLSSSVAAEQEQFSSTLPGRMIVSSALLAGRILRQVLPDTLFSALNGRMEKPRRKKGEIPLPFDHVRASINLVVSSILIASATSLKLPLSTTYVTFMVAMGSSFADGAWDRESAVYRISGVLTVIAGWFVTAFIAFTTAAIVTSIVFFGGEIAVAGLMLATLAIIIHSNFLEKKQEADLEPSLEEEKVDRYTIRETINKLVGKNLDETIDLYRDGLMFFLDEDERALKNIRNKSVALFDDISKQRRKYYRMAQQETEEKADSDAKYFYYRAFTNMREVGNDLRRVLNMARNHIANHHRVYKGGLKDNLMKMLEILRSMQAILEEYPHTNNLSDVELTQCSTESMQQISHLQIELLRQIDDQQLSLRGSELYLSFLRLTREIISRYTIVVLLQRELNEACELKAQAASARPEAFSSADPV